MCIVPQLKNTTGKTHLNKLTVGEPSQRYSLVHWCFVKEVCPAFPPFICLCSLNSLACCTPKSTQVLFKSLLLFIH